MKNKISLRPTSRLYVKRETVPSLGRRRAIWRIAGVERKSRPWLTRRDSNPYLIGYEPTALTITPQVNVVLAEP